MIGGERASGEGVQVSVTPSPDGITTVTIVASGRQLVFNRNLALPRCSG